VPKVFRTTATILASLRTKSLRATKNKRPFIFPQSEMLSRNNRPFLDTRLSVRLFKMPLEGLSFVKTLATFGVIYATDSLASVDSPSIF